MMNESLEIGTLKVSHADCRLEPAHLGALVELLCSALDPINLEMLVRFNLGDGLYQEYAGKDQPLTAIVFKLLEGLQQRGTTAVFLRSVVKARPHRQDVSDGIGTFCPHSRKDAPKTSTLVTEVVSGVHAVRDRAANPLIRTLLHGSHDYLRRMTGEIEVLARYKDLHDVLHKIQLKHYRELTHVARTLRSDAHAPDALDGYVAEMRILATDARDAATALPDLASVRGQELDWVERLDAVVTALRGIRHDADERAAFDAIRNLKSILRVEPFRVNRLLALTARALPLTPFIGVLKQIADAVAVTDPSEKRIQSGLDSLRSLEPHLLGRVSEHQLWQDIEHELWQAEEALHQPSADAWDEFKFLWERIQTQVGLLSATEPTASWVAELTPYVVACRDVCASAAMPADLSILQQAFRRYRHDALHRFYQVDLTLKSSCGEVVKIGQPLAELLAEVDHDR